MQTSQPTSPALVHPARRPGDAGLVYRSLRLAAAGRAGETDWSRFSEADWRLFARMAHPDSQGVGPLLYWNFRDGSWPAGMPDGVRRKLRDYYYHTLANNTVRFGELKHVLLALDRAGIPVILLKGAALAPLVYEDLGLRPMGDLDILVRPEHVRRTFHVLEENGFHFFKATGKALFVNRSAVPVMIELHWNILLHGSTRRLPRMDWFWDRAAPAADPRLSPGLVLSPEAHLLFLIAHQVILHVEWSDRLIWLRDMELMLRMLPDAVERLERDPIVAEFGWDAGLDWFKERAGSESGSPPRKGPGPAKGGSKSEAPANVRDPDEDVMRIFASFTALDWRTRLLLLSRILFPSAEYMQTRYAIKPEALLPLFYVVRWFDLLRRTIF